MILWTIQTEEAWSELQVGGMLHVIRENITESNWIHPYDPIWAWYQWENESRRKPDLRAAGHLSKGQKGVRIEFECCDEAALYPKFHDRIVKSWNRIFDLSWFEVDLVLPLPRKLIQATLWEISIDQVRNYTHFKSR
jgi:hypothetical protein